MQTIEQLLAAYDEEDRDAAKAALASPFIRHMDVEYARLAKMIPLPKGMTVVAPRSTVRENAAPSYIPAAQVYLLFNIFLGFHTANKNK